MKRIKMMLMAMVAVLAVGAVGTSAAQAAVGDGEATIELVGAGSCDVSFMRSAWTGTNPWTSNVSNISVATGGTCDFSGVSGTGRLTKNSTGSTVFSTSDLTLHVLGGALSCTYSGALTGLWWWEQHNNSLPVVTNTFGPPNEDKFFQVAGTATLASGGFLCPSPGSFVINARTHEIA